MASKLPFQNARPLPYDGVLTNNTHLSAFGAIRRLDLLEVFAPVHTTERVIREAEASRRGSIVSGVKKGLEAGWLVPVKAASGSDVEAVLASDESGRLSTTDAELLALARKARALLLSDDTAVGEVGRKHEVDVMDVVDVLLALKERGRLLKSDMPIIIRTLEDQDRGRKFSKQDREELLR